jgi:hypothetical protein
MTMKPLVPTLLAGVLALAAAASFAQAPSGEAGKGPMGRHHGMMSMDCSKAQDPAKCQERQKRRGEMHEAMKQAHEACKDKTDRRACMTQEMCSKASDPAKCQERAKEHHAKMSQRMDQRQAAHEACTGKRGDELAKCLGEQHKHK